MNQTYLKKLYAISDLPISVYQKGKEIWQIPENLDSIFDQMEVYEKLEKEVAATNVPVILLENENIYYGAYQSKGEIYVLGPISKKNVTDAMKLQYKHKHRLKKEAILTRMQIGKLIHLLVLLCYDLTGADIKPEDIRITYSNEDVVNWNIEKEHEEYQLEQSEIEYDHNSAEYERKLLEIIKTGDIEAATQLTNGIGDIEEEHLGMVAEGEMKSAEYLVVTLIVLSSRAAVEGGLGREEAYSLADLYLQRLQKCKTTTEIYALGSRVNYEFTLKVRNARKRASKVYYVEQCKTYIASHLREPMEVQEIADTLGMSRAYLTKKFTEEEGISIHKYIMKERCEHVANMLKYSDYSLSLIAEYFCFASQSHMGRVFKEFYDMTPKEYRNLHHSRKQF